ncbi:glycosyltransferase family 4 protein, partial [Candidatus Micrarchaeota archaeon]|nr:glycosyltransferase family 4 protein [Candidatus Micrarchaeota archaeon]
PAYYELIQELRNQGNEITVANLSGKFSDFKCIKINQFKLIDYPFGFVNRFFFSRAVSKTVNPKKFDLVLSTMAETLFFLNKWKIPKVAVIHDNFSERAKFTPFIGKQFKLAVMIDSFFQKLSMNKADGIVFLNKEEKAKAEKHTKTKCTVIHNGIYPEKFSSDENQVKKIKEKFPKKIVLFLARIELQKNPLLFLEIAKKINRKDCVFIVAGKGPLEEKLKEFINQKNLSAKVKFLGWVGEKEKIALLNACSVYVLPSLFEPVSVSTLEAMACRKPVIVSGVGGLKELVDSSIGIRVNPSNLNGFVKEVNFILDNPERSEEMGLNGFKKIKREFLWKDIAKTYLLFFREFLNEKK